MAKIKAVLRRHCVLDESGSATIGSLRLDTANNTFHFRDKTVNVTHTEELILRCLMAAHGRVVSHDELSDAIWGDPSFGEAANIRVYIRRLRKKIEEISGQPQLIMSKPGAGYYLQIPR